MVANTQEQQCDSYFPTFKQKFLDIARNMSKIGYNQGKSQFKEIDPEMKGVMELADSYNINIFILKINYKLIIANCN